MIQVCSRCGTRWNVRDRQRVWCPRCNGTLLAPDAAAPASAEQRWSPQRAAQPQPKGATRLPPGYRWIAVRPGSGPPPRRARTPLGPTPRYATIPRWGLQDHLPPVAPAAVEPERHGPSPRWIRFTLLLTMALFASAAVMHLIRYALMLVNRTYLLNRILADAVVFTTIAASALAMLALLALAIVLANWLRARRARAFERVGIPDTRSAFELYAGCLVPIVNLFFAPVYVIELAAVEGRQRDLRKPVIAWWCAWVVSFVVSSWAVGTTIAALVTGDIQRIADNTLITAVGYLVALIALRLLDKVVLAFERRPVEKAVTRWVIVRDDSAAPADAPAPESPDAGSAVQVESQQRDPAA